MALAFPAAVALLAVVLSITLQGCSVTMGNTEVGTEEENLMKCEFNENSILSGIQYEVKCDGDTKMTTVFRTNSTDNITNRYDKPLQDGLNCEQFYSSVCTEAEKWVENPTTTTAAVVENPPTTTSAAVVENPPTTTSAAVAGAQTDDPVSMKARIMELNKLHKTVPAAPPLSKEAILKQKEEKEKDNAYRKTLDENGKTKWVLKESKTSLPPPTVDSTAKEEASTTSLLLPSEDSDDDENPAESMLQLAQATNAHAQQLGAAAMDVSAEGDAVLVEAHQGTARRGPQERRAPVDARAAGWRRLSSVARHTAAATKEQASL